MIINYIFYIEVCYNYNFQMRAMQNTETIGLGIRMDRVSIV